MRATILLGVLVLVSGGVHASLVEDTTGVRYQNDGGLGQDATDACEEVAPESSGEGEATLVQGATEGGQLVPVDDPADHWRLIVDAAPGETVHVHVDSSTLVDALFDAKVAASQTPTLVQRASVQTVGCEIVDSTSFPVGQQDTLAFEPGEEARFRLSLSLDVDPAYPGSGGLFEPVPLTGHCAPTCLFAYHASLEGAR